MKQLIFGSRFVSLVFVFFAILFQSIICSAEENPASKLAWQFGPTDAMIGDKAQLVIPKGFAFLGSEDTKKYMEMLHNPPGDNEYVLSPVDQSWFAVFKFDPIGYVKDDEALDAASVLESIKRGTEQSNEERRKRGWGTMTIAGWRFEPQYDKQAKLLEWAVLAKDDPSQQDIVNYNTRLLGRSGVMQVVLVSPPATLDSSVAMLKTTLTGYKYVAGEDYTEFKQGDHIAEFGLAALVAGGAAAIATKKGFFTVILGFLAAAWKFVAIAVVGGLAWIKSLFSKKD